jgi:hypothetical protein
MLICDQVITEAETNKKSLIGLFDNVLWPGHPLALQTSIFAKLTDAEGHYRFRIEFVQVETGNRLAQADLEDAHIPDRLGFADLVLRMPMVTPAAGQYEFRLFANDSYVGRAVFTARPSP